VWLWRHIYLWNVQLKERCLSFITGNKVRKLLDHLRALTENDDDWTFREAETRDIIRIWPLSQLLTRDIVNRGEWLWSPANIKGPSKDTKIYVGRSTTVHNLLFCVHKPCMNYVTKTFQLVTSSLSSKQLLCFVHGQGQKREQKHTTKNFDEFYNHSPLLIMLVTSLSFS